MGLDLLHRIRWANVARAAAIALALLLALAWPRLRAHPEASLPTTVEPVPAVAAVKPAVAESATRIAQPARIKEATAPRAKQTARPRPAAKRRHRHVRRRKLPETRTAIPVPTPAPVHATPAPAELSAEFRP